ncbi:MAG: peptide arginase family protein [Gallionella sp.]
MTAINFATLVEDDNYHFNLGHGVWLMDNHRWALKVWETEKVNQSYTLIHADYHWDSIYDFHDSVEMEQQLLQATATQVAQLVAEGNWVRFDSFITPAIRRGLIHTVHSYCLQNEGDDNAIEPSFLLHCGANQFIHTDIASLSNAQIDAPLIFDLCLDLFNRSDQWCEGCLWSDSEINQFLCSVRHFIQSAELVTVSMSFNYSGSVADTRHLTQLVIPWVLECRERR